jgi:hypothetical protein
MGNEARRNDGAFMGTRADFYKDQDGKLVWIASIAWDGYPDGIAKLVIQVKTEDDYLSALNDFLQKRDDVSYPKDGWPWPWDDSGTTDYAYSFRKDGVYAWCFGQGPFPTWEQQPEDSDAEKETCFPDMKDVKNMTMGKRNGLIVLSA